MNQKLIMKSLSKMKNTRKSISHIPNCHLPLNQQTIINNQNIDPNYEVLSKPKLIKLLQQSTFQSQQFKRKYESLYLQSDELKVHILQLNDQVKNLTFQIQSIKQQKQEIQRYSQLLKEKYQTQIESLQLKLTNLEQQSRDQQIIKLKQQYNIMDSMYKDKLESMLQQFQQYKNSKPHRKECRRLLDMQIVKQQHLKQKLQLVTQQYIEKQEQIDNLAEKYQSVFTQLQSLKMTNELLHNELEEYKTSIDKSRKLGQIQKMNEVLQNSYQKKISILQNSIKQYQIKLQKQKGYSKRYRQQRNQLKIKIQQLQDKIKFTQQKYIQSSLAFNNVQKQYFNLQNQIKFKERDNYDTRNTLKCFMTQRSSKDQKFFSLKGKFIILCKQVRVMRQKLIELKQQIKYANDLRKDEFKKYMKQCQKMISFNMEIKDSKINRLVEQKKIIASQYHALTDRQSNYKTIQRKQQIESLKQQMEKLSKQIEILVQNDEEKRRIIKDLKQQLREKQKRQKKSKSVLEPESQERYHTTHRLLSDIYQDLAYQKNKINTTRQGLLNYKIINR